MSEGLKALPKPRSLGLALLICLAIPAIWLILSRNPLGLAREPGLPRREGELAAVVGATRVTVSER